MIALLLFGVMAGVGAPGGIVILKVKVTNIKVMDLATGICNEMLKNEKRAIFLANAKFAILLRIIRGIIMSPRWGWMWCWERMIL